MAFRRFNHLNVPEYWERYFTKYPQGMTILESLFEWVSQVDAMVDEFNLTTEKVEELQEHIDKEILLFKNYVDSKLSFTNIEKILTDWFDSGKLSSLLNNLLGLGVYVTDNTVDSTIVPNIPYTTDELRRKQNILLTSFYSRLNKSEALTIETIGDSTTYGHDTVSSNIRPPMSDTTTDTSQPHERTQASVTYPEALKQYLNEINRTNITVINRGFSGDTTKTSYPRWTTNKKSQLSLIMFGLNDTVNTITEFRDNYIKIIARQILRGSAVVLLTPITTIFPKQPIEDYTRVLYDLADMFGLPLIEMDNNIANYSMTLHSDDFHLNGTGYQLMAARLMPIFIGNGVSKPLFVSTGDKLLTRLQLDSIYMTRGASGSSTGANDTPDENYANLGISARLTDVGATVYYSFYTTEDDTIVIPDIFKSGIGIAEVTLDFNTVKPKHSLSLSVGKPNGSSSADIITQFTVTDSIFSKQSLKVASDKRYLHVVKKGWHTVAIKKTEGAADFYVRGLEFISHTDYKQNLQKGFYELPSLYQVSSTEVDAMDIAVALGITPIDTTNVNDYWLTVPVTISVHSYNEAITKQVFNFSNLGLADNWVLSQTTQTYNLKDTPTGIRSVSAISYNPTTRKITFTWSGSGSKTAKAVITIG